MIKKPHNFSKTIQKLTNSNSDSLKLSIYMPTNPEWRDSDEDKIRLKNAIDRAETALIEAGVEKNELENYVSELYSFQENEINFWKETKKGVAFFSDKINFYYLIFPIEFKPFIYVGQKFNLRPMVDFLNNDESFYLLQLTLNYTKLYKGNWSGIREVKGIELPNNTQKIEDIHDHEVQVQHHTTKAINKGSQGGMTFHGHGSYKDGQDHIKYLFLKDVDEEINRFIKDKETPLFVSSIKNTFDKYESINTYPNFINRFIKFDEDDHKKELLNKVLKVKSEKKYREKQDSLNRFGIALEKSYAITDIDEIEKNSKWGKVDTLLVDPTYGFEKPIDQVNLCIIETLKNSGIVYSVFGNEIKGSSGIGAILRY